MVIALVGHNFTDKAKIAKDIRHYTGDLFTRMGTYTTRVNVGKSYLYASQEDFKHMKDVDMFHYSSDENHDKFFVTRSMFMTGQNLIYVVDDPRGVEEMDTLGVPYAVVYVDSNMTAILNRARKSTESLRSVKSRIEDVKPRMRKFEKSGQFSLYLDTSNMSASARYTNIGVFCDRVHDWMRDNSDGAVHMPFICDVFGSDWKTADTTVKLVTL